MKQTGVLLMCLLFSEPVLLAQQGNAPIRPKPIKNTSSITKVTPKPQKPTSTEVANPVPVPLLYSEKFKEKAFLACKAIQRIPVLEDSMSIYDNRLSEAEKLVDEADLSMNEPNSAEAEVLNQLKVELIAMQWKRTQIDVAKAKAASENLRVAALLPGSTALKLTELDGAEQVSKAIEQVSKNLVSPGLQKIEQALRMNKRLAELQSLTQGEPVEKE